MFIIIGVLTFLNIKTKESLYLIILGAVSLVLFIVLIVSMIVAYKSVYKKYYNGIFKTTVSNLNSIAKNDGNLKDYPTYKIEEFDQMNSDLINLKKTLANSTLITNEIDYST